MCQFIFVSLQHDRHHLLSSIVFINKRLQKYYIMIDIQNIKNRYSIIGNNLELNHSLSVAVQVATNDLSVLITGESGVGKDVFSKIIHENSSRKHKNLVAVNCGAIPEGTIESELFGHVKGAFTSADKDRKGYFEMADGGTIFLDEIGELPLAMQAKLLRVLQSGEMMRVGSSETKKVNVRVVAATNMDITKAIKEGKFRTDLYYRLNQIPIYLPPLRERKEDIELLFRKFASDIADTYKMKPLKLTESGKEYFINYPWYGNIRELKNITEQISIIEKEREITDEIAMKYLQYSHESKLPAIYQHHEVSQTTNTITDRELLLKALSMGQMISEMRNEINELKKTLAALMQSGIKINSTQLPTNTTQNIHDEAIYDVEENDVSYTHAHYHDNDYPNTAEKEIEEDEFVDTEIIYDEPLALEEREKNAIRKALEKHNGNRKNAAMELHISERTLYRKLREYGIQ